MMRWAVFKDFRGVAYCEPVNEALAVWIKNVPAREEKRHWLTRKITQHKRDAERRQKVVFDENVYSRKDYVESAFEPAPEGYEFRDDIRYLVENRWGPVDVILFIEDDNLGRRMQYEFRRLSPDSKTKGINHHGQRDNSAKPHPDTDRVIEKLRLVV